MCNAITIPSVAWLSRAVRRWRGRGSGSVAVPVGHVAVCAEGARFVVRLAHLGHPAFVELLRQAEEEYGFPAGASGPVALPCDEDRLRDVLSRVSGRSFSYRRSRGDSRPLLQDVAIGKLVSLAIEATTQHSPPQARGHNPQLRPRRRRRHDTGGTVWIGRTGWKSRKQETRLRFPPPEDRASTEASNQKPSVLPCWA